ncbi:bifunctional nicotinamidase/pyrazinamidase [Pedobacter gandavensis]|uniref:bifunctional nicotinamidase/pyrazinamidase n=1 Tax=Pedobacter gandavensis TaxID=2679963 RepID=UPI00292E3457|nr:bifunctional nicotinamidase/pyrazinamidase [Pedobacter gandavensis]
MNALIIIDVQYDFLPGGPLGVNNGDEIIQTINMLQSTYDLVVATQDWHPIGHKSFYTSHSNKKPFEEISLNGVNQILWPEHCLQGTKGAELVTELSTNNIEAIFRKGMDKKIDSYSGFFDNARKKATGMADYLKGRGITSVAVCGLAADFCVYYTASDALDLGFKSSIIDCATKPIDPKEFEEIKKHFQQKGGTII